MEKVFSKEFKCKDDDEEITQYLNACGLLIIDDFHHLEKPVRDKIAFSLKRWHEKGIRIIIVGIASTTKNLIDIDSEVSIRNDYFEMKTQKNEFLNEVIQKGEEALNISFSEETKNSFVNAAQGMPSAIQIICRVACVRNEIFETLPEKRLIHISIDNIKDGVIRTYKSKYFNKIIGLAKGKQQARSIHNTYFDIIKQLCLMDEYEIGIEDLKLRILSGFTVRNERNRKLTSINNCLNNIRDVIHQKGLDDTLYYNENSNVISIEDPSFRLYLNLLDLTEIEKQVKVRNTSYPWDVAVSFAGEDRVYVEELKRKLNSRGYTVFYDFDLQYQLWGENLERKLSDVYKHDAQYMVIFLSQHYPQKDWTRFEFEIGKEASEKRTAVYLLPLLLDDTHIVGLSRDIGFFDLRKHTMDEAVEALVEKIENQ
ncbi:MAG: hypothetical protein JL50_08695 [Peptococcaceae bacterium BICA1-7]|nr:MAG: hypothetical protein JL50_08695 [Peptococcaceae bacterium BICA1-7]